MFFDSSFDRFDVLFSFFKERQSVFLFDRYLFKKQKNYVVVDVSFEQGVRSVKILKNIIEDMYVFCKK